MPKWDDIRLEWETTKITLVALAEKHDVKLGTLKSRKSREKWSRDPSKKLQPKKDATEKVATPKEDATASNKKQKNKPEIKEPVIVNEDLNDRQRLFCIYYLKYFNATKAYQKAYGCSYESAMASGHRLFRNVEIKAEIERLKEERTSEKLLSIDVIIQKYIDIALADITDFAEFGKRPVDIAKVLVGFDEDDNPIYERKKVYHNYVDFKDHTEVDGSILTEVRMGKDGIAVKLADKMRAMEMLTKYLDFLPEAQKRKLEEEKLKMELAHMRGETEGDAHEQGSSYEDALNAQAEDVFADEVDDYEEA